MLLPHVNPHEAGPRPCWQYTQLAGMAYGDTSTLCALPNAPRVQADPAHGCSGFTREVGADDEPGPPTAVMARPVLVAAASAPAAVRWAP